MDVTPLPATMRGRTPRWLWVGAGSGALLALAALAAALTWTSIFDSALASQLALTPTSRSFRDWVEPTVPLYFDIYFFNWTNSERFPDEKPDLVQLGPYRFIEKRKHVNITWHDNNGTVAYKTQRSWFFDEQSSNGTLQDNITTLNAIAASAVYRSRFWGFLQQKGLSMGLAMFNQNIAVSKLARELLFEGYDDPLLDLAKSLPSSTTGGAPPVDKFAWFYERNNSLETDGYMEVSTGQLAGTLPGQILKWNYEDHIPYYEGECSKLSGSAGEFIARNLTEDSTLTMFVPDLCRTVNMEYVDSGEQEGLLFNKYALTQTSFDNSTTSPSNTCFCNGECLWSGVMNVSACRYGSPAFLSLPHFLHGDAQLRDHVTGMQPDPEAHSFYFAVEPPEEQPPPPTRASANGECLWSGVMNVSACRYGSPAFLSLPHFLHGDAQLRDHVTGMQPDPEAHSFYFAVEPVSISGVMNVSACRYGSPAFLSLPHFLHGDAQLRDHVTGMQPDPEAHSFYFAVEPSTV
ncbi:hypothetical protein PYW07_001956 [Mythimna separata]|uniref:Protein peste n=1 Tax=Mythimna separata TaxID=271217 RepID=A0AAD8DTP9_MYTSE|nr:hypothetical protein PYW07_001956 [Mythimna separata]